MADEPIYGYSEADAKRIGRAVSYVEGARKSATGIGMVADGRVIQFKYGKLDGTLSSGGTATMSVWTIDMANGGLDSDTGDNITVVDADLIPVDVTLASGTPCKACYSQGGWILDGYRCQN